jgi:hypothetical protein
MYDLARNALMNLGQAQDLSAKLEALEKSQNVNVNPFKAQIDSIAPAQSRGGRRFFGRGGGRLSINLSVASSAALSASLALQSAEMAPTEAQIAACTRARKEVQDAMARWNTLKSSGLASFNATLKTRGQPAVTLPALRAPVALPADANGNVNEHENEG